VTPTLRATSVLTRHKWIARFRLRVIEGPDAGAVAESRGVEVSVGTAEVSDLRLTDPSVSRHHCVLVVADDGIRLRDLDSTNGTAINGVRVSAAYVTPPARITMGRTTLAFEAIDREYCEALSRSDRFGDLLGESEAMRRIFALAEKVAQTDATVLIEGETGCGKGLLAEAIHDASARAGNSFTLVDCASLPAALIESELFGHEKGAFTGAEGRRIGLFETAGGGTVFLDEVGELPIDLQPKLLRVVESHTVARVGSTQRVPVDFRLIAATNRDLRSSVNRGTFRADLLYRLNGVRLVIPPLRDRREDIPLLLAHFYAQLTGVPDRQPPPELVSLAMQSDWPGNVRELRNAVERSRLDETLEAWYGEPRPGNGPTGFNPAMPFKVAKEHAMARWEVAYLRELMTLAQGNLTRAAEMVQMDRGHLRQLLRRYKLWT
jgi:two-component system, NtrC family, response regulator GlrR